MTDPIQPIGRPKRDIPPITPVQRRQWRVDEEERKQDQRRRQPRRDEGKSPPEDGEHLIDVEA